MNHDQSLADVGRTVARVTRLLGLAIPFLFGVALSVHAVEPIPIDDFNDGNDDGWSHLDLISDQPWGPAIFDASSGEYRISSTGLVPDIASTANTSIATTWDASADPFYSNGLMRTRFRIDENATSFALLMRGNTTPEFYSFGAASFDVGFPDPGGPNAGGVFFFDKREGAAFTHSELFFVDEPHLGDEWMLEAGAVGDQLSMKWWPVGDPEPTDPQWEWTDPSPLAPGLFGARLYISTAGATNTMVDPPWRIGATFDDLYFTPVPEPSGMLLACLGIAVLPCARRRNWLARALN